MATQTRLDESGVAKRNPKDNTGGKMKKAMSMFAASVMIAGLCAGCGKADKSEPKAAEQPKTNNAKNWKPETAKQPKAHNVNDGQDHSGHNH